MHFVGKHFSACAVRFSHHDSDLIQWHFVASQLPDQVTKTDLVARVMAVAGDRIDGAWL